MSKIFPLAILAGIGAWFARDVGSAQAGAQTQGQGGGGLFGAAWNSIWGVAQEAPAAPSVPVAMPLPRNVTLSLNQVLDLAKRTVQKHGFVVSPQELTVTAYLESSFRPWVFREEKTGAGKVWDTSFGLMQTLTGTAQDMFNKGYRAMGAPTKENLLAPEVSMYFGAAYKDWLKRSYGGKSAEWYIRAYNGGPGWERTQNGPANTAIYHQRFVSHAIRLFGAA